MNDLMTPDQLNTLATAIISLLGTVLTGIITILGKHLNKWLSSKAKSAELEAITQSLVDVTKICVMDAEKTLVAEVKNASKDGKLTKEEAATIFKNVFEAVKANLGKKGMKSLRKVYSEQNINQAIAAHIEQRINEMKR